jgi:hypothetical protein
MTYYTNNNNNKQQQQQQQQMKRDIICLEGEEDEREFKKRRLETLLSESSSSSTSSLFFWLPKEILYMIAERLATLSWMDYVYGARRTRVCLSACNVPTGGFLSGNPNLMTKKQIKTYGKNNLPYGRFPLLGPTHPNKHVALIETPREKPVDRSFLNDVFGTYVSPHDGTIKKLSVFVDDLKRKKPNVTPADLDDACYNILANGYSMVTEDEEKTNDDNDDHCKTTLRKETFIVPEYNCFRSLTCGCKKNNNIRTFESFVFGKEAKENDYDGVMHSFHLYWLHTQECIVLQHV